MVARARGAVSARGGLTGNYHGTQLAIGAHHEHDDRHPMRLRQTNVRAPLQVVPRCADSRAEKDAAVFAAGRTYYGKPATADHRDVSPQLARRWGF